MGVLQKANGDRYEGTFSSDSASGFGTIFYSSGDVYVGNVSNFKKSGKGRMYHHE